MHAGRMDWDQEELNKMEKWPERTGCNLITAHATVQTGIRIINCTNTRSG